MHIAPIAIISLCIKTSHPAKIKQCISKVYCAGPILDAVQRSGLFADSKWFVDMPSKYPEKTVIESFSRLPKNPRFHLIKQFVEENFLPAGTELEATMPDDWSEHPAFLEKIHDNQLQSFARLLHEKWKSLIRKVNQSKFPEGAAMSSLNLPFPFVIPGGRFREFYYWDSYYILEGLLVSEMCGTAKWIVENMLAMVNEFGFIPNGARQYYLNRSQQPLLISMIDKYINGCMQGSVERDAFLDRAVPLMLKEYEFWMDHRSVDVDGVQLNVFKADHHEPRPESYREDILIANLRKGDRRQFFQDVASAAESGWDFSGRWFEDWEGMELIKTSKIVPVDLNALMFYNEQKLAGFFANRNASVHANLTKSYQRRQTKMERVMFDGQAWYDYDLDGKVKRDKNIYLSGLAPLWFDVDSRPTIPAIFNQLVSGFAGGAVVSMVNSGQQWDYPNVWAPLQHRIMEWALKHGHRSLAIDIAQRFINSCYCGYKKYGYIFEKYHGLLVGEPGGGGEYVVQEGFGWTNGVLLWIFKEFPDLKAPSECPIHESSYMTAADNRLDFLVTSIIILVIAGFVFLFYRLLIY